MLTAGFRGEKTITVNALQSALSSKSAATVTPVHAYDGILSTVSRTAGQVALLLCAECSAEQAPVLDTDFCPQPYHTMSEEEEEFYIVNQNGHLAASEYLSYSARPATTACLILSLA